MNRTTLINYLIDQYSFTRYLEIGVNNEAHNFSNIRCDHKVGVDIKPVSTFCGSSDDFFKINNEKFDIIFIDGLHTEQQVLQDIQNAFECLAEGGVIVLHDCLPPDCWHQREAEQFIDGEEWNGTVWKAALRVFNKIAFKCTVLDDDWGCGIIDTNKKQTPLQLDLPVELSYDEHYNLLLEYKIETIT
jgi:SAM-dependent methyltransferase